MGFDFLTRSIAIKECSPKNTTLILFSFRTQKELFRLTQWNSGLSHFMPTRVTWKRHAKYIKATVDRSHSGK